MIIFFGPTGSGKSLQGKMLEDECGFKLISVGRLLRESQDQKILESQKKGVLVDDRSVYRLLKNALDKCNDEKIIIDGFPRRVQQAEWLIANYKNDLDVAVVIDLSHNEVLKRLKMRARFDDTEDSIEYRLQIFEKEITPILEYLINNNINVKHVDGVGSIEEVHNRIKELLKSCNLI